MEALINVQGGTYIYGTIIESRRANHENCHSKADFEVINPSTFRFAIIDADQLLERRQVEELDHAVKLYLEQFRIFNVLIRGVEFDIIGRILIDTGSIFADSEESAQVPAMGVFDCAEDIQVALVDLVET